MESPGPYRVRGILVGFLNPHTAIGVYGYESRKGASTVSDEAKQCPHCSGALTKWGNPEDSSWGQGYQLVCFNDQCPYYVRGWQWMKDNYQQKASYRYRYDPQNKEEGPLPVWSDSALRDGILDDEGES